MLADAHIHLWDERRLAAYEALRARHAIGSALVVGYEGAPEHAGNNAAVLAWSRTRPWLVPFAYATAADGEPERLAALLDAGFRGVALYLDAAAARAFAAWPRETFALLVERGAAISLNAPPEALAPLAAADVACPLLISHLGLPGAHARPPARAEAEARLAPLLALAAQPRVHVKLSGLYAISDPPHAWPHPQAQPFADAVLAAFGPERVVWGSDYPPALDACSFAQLVDCRLLDGLPATARAAVMGGTLERLLAASR